MILQAAEKALQSTAEGRLELPGGYSFSEPWFFLCALLAALALWWGRARKRHVAGRVPAIPADLPRSPRQYLVWLPRTLEVAALLLSIIALARPLRGNVELTSTSEGIDIVLLVDRSTSMTARDLETSPDDVDGRSRARRPGDPVSPTRLDVVKDVVGEFAARRMTDRDGAADNVALVVFAGYPELLCPFTLDSEALTGLLEEVTFAGPDEGGTGIGVALAKAVAVLKESEAKSRVTVLLTDGQNNVESILPMEAGRLAAENDVRVYCVFAGRFASDPFGRMVPSDRLDTSDLEAIAGMTGGLFFRARDRAALQECYAEIERLERTEREESRFAEHFDLYPGFLIASIVCFFLSWFSACTWARRLP